MPVAAIAAGAVAGGISQGIGGIMSADAANKAGKQQSRALDKIAKFTQEQMDPALIAQKAREQDIQRAKDRLALQAQIDPELAKQRGISEAMITQQLGQIGQADADRVAAAAAAEGLKGVPGMDEAKKGLIDAALTELKLGAKLPPDVQAELMQAGLQQAGQMTGAARGGAGTNILSEVLGTAGLNLRSQREAQAAQLSTAAGNLEAQRQQILQGLFPRLQEQQLKNLAATSGIFQQSDAALPQVGLSGADVANVWLQRVGALNKLAGQKSNVQAQAALATAAGKQAVAQSFPNTLGSMSGLLGGIGGTKTPEVNSILGASGNFPG